VELDERFPAEHRDVRTFDPHDWGVFDIILASPPCQSFSILSISKNWTHDNQPKSATAILGQELVLRTKWIIKRAQETNPNLYFIIENPRAKLRKMGWLDEYERRTVTQCQYGKHVMKPTDLWGRFPEGLVLKPTCNNGDPCHVRAPRGSTTGVQGMSKFDSAKIPYPLALDVCLAMENLFPKTSTPPTERAD
jgi:hypothetical protein